MHRLSCSCRLARRKLRSFWSDSLRSCMRNSAVDWATEQTYLGPHCSPRSTGRGLEKVPYTTACSKPPGLVNPLISLLAVELERQRWSLWGLAYGMCEHWWKMLGKISQREERPLWAENLGGMVWYTGSYTEWDSVRRGWGDQRNWCWIHLLLERTQKWRKA